MGIPWLTFCYLGAFGSFVFFWCFCFILNCFTLLFVMPPNYLDSVIFVLFLFCFFLSFGVFFELYTLFFAFAVMGHYFLIWALIPSCQLRHVAPTSCGVELVTVMSIDVYRLWTFLAWNKTCILKKDELSLVLLDPWSYF